MSDETFWDADRLETVVSQRAKTLGPLVWAAARPERGPVISFSGGLPDIPSLPDDLLIESTRRALANDRKRALEYAGTFGTPLLREAIAERSSAIEGIPLTADNVIITSGSAHGIGVVCEVLLDPGDVVLAESPNFPGSLRTLRSFGAELIGVPMDEHGVRVDLVEEELERLASEGKRPKLLYTIPNFQNPAGLTLPLERRERLVELARQHEFFLLEDDAYGELWFDAAPPPSLFSLSGGDHGIKVSSFSKIIATGLRMGWTMGPPAFISRMASVRYDMGSSPYLGHVITDMIRSGSLDRHVVRLREIYRRKLERMHDALQRHCEPYMRYQLPQGGFFLWLELREDIPAGEVQKAAAERGVIVGTGPGFYVDGQATNHLRLAFSYVPTEDIEEGVHRLAEAIRDVLAARGAK